MEREHSKFEQLDTQVVGISVDSIHSQKAFATQLGVKSFPLASDFKKEVATAYDVLHPEGHTERATVIIDKQGIVRWTQQVPLNQQRDVNEWQDELRKLEGTLRQ